MKSIGIIFETAVNAPGLVSFRSIRSAQRPPCTICPSTANVPGRSATPILGDAVDVLRLEIQHAGKLRPAHNSLRLSRL